MPFQRVQSPPVKDMSSLLILPSQLTIAQRTVHHKNVTGKKRNRSATRRRPGRTLASQLASLRAALFPLAAGCPCPCCCCCPSQGRDEASQRGRGGEKGGAREGTRRSGRRLGSRAREEQRVSGERTNSEQSTGHRPELIDRSVRTWPIKARVAH